MEMLPNAQWKSSQRNGGRLGYVWIDSWIQINSLQGSGHQLYVTQRLTLGSAGCPGRPEHYGVTMSWLIAQLVQILSQGDQQSKTCQGYIKNLLRESEEIAQW